MHIRLDGGPEIKPVFEQEMWRAKVDGRQFCSQTKEGLVRALASRYSLSVHYEKAPIVELKGREKWLHILQHSNSLEEKQEARRELVFLGYEWISPPLSRDAEQIAKKLNKEFLDLTVQELTQHVNNIVLRNKLITELAEGHKLDA